jgi:predicted anti-sigma-YlaC factor YlaD
MNCNKIHKSAIAYLEHKLTETEQNDFAGHLAQCQDCREAVGKISKVWLGLNEKPELKFNPYLITRIEAKIQKETQRQARPAWAKVMQPVLASVVVGLGLYLGILLGSTFTESDQTQLTTENQQLVGINDLQQESLESFLLDEETN